MPRHALLGGGTSGYGVCGIGRLSPRALVAAAMFVLPVALSACAVRTPSLTAGADFLRQDGAPFLVKGVVYVPAYPGHLPWELASAPDIPEQLKASIRDDVHQIEAMGANTIRLWDAPTYCYWAIGQRTRLLILQTIWFEGQLADFQDPAFKAQCKLTIARVVDRLYASTEAPPRILAYLVGNELSRESVTRTDERHPAVTRYDGAHVQAPEGSTATACFLAEMADYVKAYELAQHGRQHLVSYANDIRTADVLETPFLDFQSVNAYLYAAQDYGTTLPAWVAALKARHPEKPLLLTETGLSVAPRAPHNGPPHYGYGGNTPEEQAAGLVQTWQALRQAARPVAGMCIHEYLDAWWKFGKADAEEHDPQDVEEWFGLAALEPEGNWYATHPRKAYGTMRALWLSDPDLRRLRPSP